MGKTRPTVVLTRRWPEAVEDEMQLHFEVRLNHDDRPFSAAELSAALSVADAVCPTVTDDLSAAVLTAPTTLQTRILGNFGVGYNHIDLAAAGQRGLTVTNTPGVLTDATADIALTLLLMVTRRAGEGEREIRSGRWSGWRPTHLLGQSISGKTLGLVGFGRIGQAVARRAHHGFGMRVIYHTPTPRDRQYGSASGAEYCASLDALLEQADVVSIHCPASPQTHHLFNAERLARMKPGAYLINTARGEVVDEMALLAALDAGDLAGAGLDVYTNEPAVPAQLLVRENVVLLPHLGSATVPTRSAMGMCVLDNLLAFFAGTEPPNRLI